MKKSKLINQLISRPNTPINTPTQNQFTNCELEQIDKQAVEEKNCKECLHFEACCKWTDFPRQIGFPTCRKFNPVESYRKQGENTVEEMDDIIIDLFTEFDEMGFAPTTTVPDPEAYAINWRNKLTNVLKDYRKQGEVIEEYRQKVNTKMGKHTHLLGKEYVQRILREVAKEMKGGE